MNRKWMILPVGFIVVGFVIVFVLISNQENTEKSEIIAQSEAITEEDDTPQVQSELEEPAPEFDTASIQSVIDEWMSDVPTTGTASVQILDADGESIASFNPDEEYTAASIYKLFVAYLGYAQIDRGDADPDEQYTTELTRAECLDTMIRDSNNSCAEQMWNEFDKRTQNEQLQVLGIEDTNMVLTTTTPTDAAMLLQLVSNGRGLSSDSRQAYLDSLLNQPDFYRTGLPSGFSDGVLVYNKVGFNENNIWHDSAIVEFEDGRQMTVSVFTQNVGKEKIAELAEALEKAI